MKRTIRACPSHADCVEIHDDKGVTHERMYASLQTPVKGPMEATAALFADMKEEITQAHESIAAQRIELRNELADVESEARRLLDPLRTTLEHLRVATAQETKSALARAEAKFQEIAEARDELDRQPLVS